LTTTSSNPSRAGRAFASTRIDMPLEAKNVQPDRSTISFS